MNGSIRVSAKTVDDAITEAMIQLGVTSDRLEYEVIEKGSSGFLGIGMKQAVIEARRKPESEPEVVEKEPFAPVEEIREEKAEEIAEPVKAEVKEEAPVVEKQEERPAEEPKKAAWKDGALAMWIKIIIACIPAAIVGLIFDDKIDELFYHPIPVAIALIVVGIVFIVVENDLLAFFLIFTNCSIMILCRIRMNCGNGKWIAFHPSQFLQVKFLYRKIMDRITYHFYSITRIYKKGLECHYIWEAIQFVETVFRVNTNRIRKAVPS